MSALRQNATARLSAACSIDMAVPRSSVRCLRRAARHGAACKRTPFGHGASPIPAHPWQLRGRGLTRRFDLPSAFKPAGARIEPPSAQEDLPLHPVRNGGTAAARSIVVGMDRRHRRPMAAAIARQCCEFCEHRSPRFHCAAEPVSAKESDRLVAVAYPNAAVIAAIGIDVLRCRRSARSHTARVTKGSTTHSLVVYDCTLVLPLFTERRSARTPPAEASQACIDSTAA